MIEGGGAARPSFPASGKATTVLKINDRLSIPLDEFRWEYSRSGGPGGQNVNKVNSKAQLRWNPSASPSLPDPVRARLLVLVGNRLTTEGDLLIASQASRDQSKNVETCLEKLRGIVLAAATPPRTRRPTKPTYSSRLKRVEDKAKRSQTKQGRRKPEAE